MDDLNFEGWTCPVPIRPTDTVILGHGSGGTLSRDLLNRLFLPELGKAAPRALVDSAVVVIDNQRYALTTDSHVVSPLFFPAGDIGRLGICGTVNDLAMVGATPVALTCGFVLEEGLSFELLQRVVKSMEEAAKEAGVYIAAGDTKVVQRGGADKIFINTSGIGKIKDGINISGANAKEGDVVIVSGTIGDHGIAVMERIRARFAEDFRRLGECWCPLTATAAEVHATMPPERRDGRHWVLVATAHPAKFNEIVEPLVSQAVPVPPALSALLDLPSRYQEIAPDLASLRAALQAE